MAYSHAAKDYQNAIAAVGASTKRQKNSKFSSQKFQRRRQQGDNAEANDKGDWVTEGLGRQKYAQKRKQGRNNLSDPAGEFTEDLTENRYSSNTVYNIY